MATRIPEGYKTKLDINETQKAIELIHDVFSQRLGALLGLHRVSAPLFVRSDTGLNDDLNGVERAVDFDIAATDTRASVVHSLAKWKRVALWRYGFEPGEGIYTNMNAIRRDEELDNLHSVYTDQWDWEKIITPAQRNIAFLRETVNDIVKAVCDTNDALCKDFPALTVRLSREVFFITSQELEDMFPALTPKEREDEITRLHPTVFLMQIGGALRSGKPHDGRAPDYDDWTMNGDLLFRDDVLGHAMEISSMGIRVDAAALRSQLRVRGLEEREKLYFHSLLLDGKLPLTIGGGIGQSRLCMLLLQKAHIGEVQSSIWDNATVAECNRAGIELL